MITVLQKLPGNAILCNRGCGINYCQRRAKIPFGSVPADTWFIREKLSDKIAVDISWSQLEIREGEFLWDQPEWEGCFRSWMDAGFKILLKVRGMDTLGTFYNQGTPQWVFDAGARFVDEPIGFYRNSWLLNEIPGDKNMPIRYPVYWDDVYLEKVTNLVNALGKRYNGNPGIESVAIAHMGRWGEMHIADHYDHEAWLREGFSIPRYQEAHRAIIDAYCNAFPDTPLQQSIGEPCFDITHIQDAMPCMEYLASRGVMLKCGGLGKAWHGRSQSPWLDNATAEILKKYKYQSKIVFENLILPEALEYALDLGMSYWQRGGEAPGLGELNIAKDIPVPEKKIYSLYKFYPEAYSRWKQEDQMEIWRHLARRTGYRIAAEAIDTEVTGNTLKTVFYWSNCGAAPCYETFDVCISLCDQNGNSVWTGVQPPACGCSPRIWESRAHFSDGLNWKLPVLPQGEYLLCFGLRHRKYAQEMMSLANAGRNASGMYPVTRIPVKR